MNDNLNLNDVDKAQAVVNDGFAVMYELLKKAADAFTDDNTNRAYYFMECISDTCFAIKDKMALYENALAIAAEKERNETSD